MTDTKWLTVDEASFLCKEMGLDRTKKTMRNWAKNDHVTARKQTTHHGEMWVLEKPELVAKIKAELEFARQRKADIPFQDPSTHERNIPNLSGRVRNVPEDSAPVWKEAESVSRDAGDLDARDQIRSLKTQIQALSVDVQWRDKMLDRLTRENERMLENMHGQARYIGHLESDLLRLGGAPDQQFLQAPKVQPSPQHEPANDNTQAGDQLVHPIKPHPDQQSFISG
ncbi:MAG: hypothetical protein ABJN35_14175 [Erythrobacter sp.]